MAVDRRTRLLRQLGAISPMPDDDTLARSSGLDSRYARIVADLYPVADESCIEPVIASFGYGYGFDVYETAAAILLGLPAARVRPKLLQALGAVAAGSRMWAADLLGALGKPEDVPALATALVDPLPLVRLNAATTLARLGGPAAVSALRTALADPDAEVRDAAIRALNAVEGTVP